MTRGLAFSILCLLALGACSTAPERDPIIGEAYVGPATLPIRDDLTLRAPVVATVNHGDKLDITARRRRFYKVRTSKGVEGWVDGQQLLGEGEITALRKLAGESSRMPSMGAATVFDPLNVHTVPNRNSPSFAQVPVDGTVDVLGRIVIDRAPYEPPELVTRVVATAAAPKKTPKEKALPPPPRPAPPPVPENWLELSGNPQLIVAPDPDETPELVPPREDWALIRLKDGTTGWTLSRPLIMAIPDEVAQYAERARIIAFFSLEAVQDSGQPKNTWLWATRVSATEGCDFDSFRVFIWSLKRHRYETSYIERKMRGFLPVDARPGVGAVPPAFAILAEDAEGKLTRREYVFQSGRVRLSKKEPAERPAPLWSPPSASASKQPATAVQPPQPTIREQVVGILKGLRNRLRR